MKSPLKQKTFQIFDVRRKQQFQLILHNLQTGESNSKRDRPLPRLPVVELVVFAVSFLFLSLCFFTFVSLHIDFRAFICYVLAALCVKRMIIIHCQIQKEKVTKDIILNSIRRQLEIFSCAHSWAQRIERIGDIVNVRYINLLTYYIKMQDCKEKENCHCVYEAA